MQNPSTDLTVARLESQIRTLDSMRKIFAERVAHNRDMLESYGADKPALAATCMFAITYNEERLEALDVSIAALQEKKDRASKYPVNVLVRIMQAI